MGLELNHAIVRCSDRTEAALFFSRLIGADGPRQLGSFAAVQINDRLTLDFYDGGPFVFGHFAFLVDDSRFEAILSHAITNDLDHGSGPFTRDRTINRLNGGRGIYVWDRDGNSYEFFTVDPLA